MKSRKILAALLATSCAMSMAVPAFAAGGDEQTMPETSAAASDLDVDALQSYALEVDASIQKPSLKVTLPSSTAVLVNPYRIEVKLDATNTTFDTIISPEMDIVNNSGCAIKVNVKGMLQTYQVVDKDADTAVAVSGVSGSANGKTFADGDVKTTDKKVFFEASTGRVLTGKYTPAKDATATAAAVPEAYVVSGYTASKDIKVATAPMKDVDADKSNTLFIYVEGKIDGNEYASAYDAKATAGVKDTKTGVMSVTGQMALAAKDATKAILYLNAGETGHARVTGQASTAPTKAWTSLTDEFETPFTFVIDAVANEAPKAPVATDIKIGGVSIAGFDPATLAYTATANSGDGLLVVAATAEAGATTDITVSGVLTKTGTNIMMTGAGEGVVTITLSKYGLTTTYTITVTVS